MTMALTQKETPNEGFYLTSDRTKTRSSNNAPRSSSVKACRVARTNRLITTSHSNIHNLSTPLKINRIIINRRMEAEVSPSTLLAKSLTFSTRLRPRAEATIIYTLHSSRANRASTTIRTVCTFRTSTKRQTSSPSSTTEEARGASASSVVIIPRTLRW